VKFGINGPYMSGTNREILLEWFRRVDQGPFATLGTGERVLWPQIEQQAFLAAAAAVTHRVQILANIMVLPMHAPILLAKRLASIDVISGGRLTLGVGAGGREDDYRAADMPFRDRWQAIDDSVDVLQRCWRGELPWAGASDPIGPKPVRPGGVPLYTSASGPKSLLRAAQWADGWIGAMMTLEREPMRTEVQRHRDAWDQAGRSDTPYMINSAWFYLGDNAEQHLSDTAAAYVGLPPGSPSPFGENPLHSATAVKQAVEDCKEAGFDELIFVPLNDDIGQLDLLEDALEGL
jgi:alkanesulfonate monooxygenase SsuD/methylene tetrahydromethanopterin reductase-like flavin-dependent oxidoreductase (luciferase family)